MVSRFLGLALGASLLAGSILASTLPAAAAEERRLVLGRITQEPGRNVERLTAMARYLAGELAADGIASVEIVIVDTPERMAEMLRSGQVDLFSETAFVAFDLMDKGLADPFLREWKKGVAEYHSVIVARADSGIASLADLKGRRFAFEDAGSTSGYFLPRHAIEDAGLTLSALADPRAKAPADAVGYSFANGEINVVAWVNRGLADAGAVSNIDWQSEDKAPERLRRDLTVIHRTPSVIRSLMMVNRSMSETLRQRLAAVFTSMHETEDGRAVLKEYFSVSRYDALAGDALAGLENARHARLRPGGTGE